MLFCVCGKWNIPVKPAMFEIRIGALGVVTHFDKYKNMWMEKTHTNTKCASFVMSAGKPYVNFWHESQSDTHNRN